MQPFETNYEYYCTVRCLRYETCSPSMMCHRLAYIPGTGTHAFRRQCTKHAIIIFDTIFKCMRRSVSMTTE